MTLRERLANWLTGGAYQRIFDANTELSIKLTGLRATLEKLDKEYDRVSLELAGRSSITEAQAHEATERAYQLQHDLNFAEKALRAAEWGAAYKDELLDRIIACETPSANATVRKMVRIAKERTEGGAVLRVKNGLSSLEDEALALRGKKIPVLPQGTKLVLRKNSA